MKVFVTVLCIVSAALAGPVQQDESVMRSMVGTLVNCVNSDLSLCLKEHALKATEKLRTLRKLNIIDGLTVHIENQKEGRSLEPLSDELEIRKKQVSERLWDSTSELLQGAELEVNFSGSDEGDSRALSEVEEGRGKKKKAKKALKALIPLAILAKIKAGFLALALLAVIALSLFKLAAIAKLALIAKAIVIIKALLAKKSEEHATWVPHEEHSHGWENSGGWSRRNEGQNMAYSAYRK